MKRVKLLDLVVDAGLANSIIEAEALIRAGQIRVDQQIVDKPHTFVAADCELSSTRARFVSRGGEKLWGALEDLGLLEKIKGRVCADIGSSTGGFTDCLLQCAAQKVYAIDVGKNLLDWKLRNDSRVVVCEQTKLESCTPSAFPDVEFVVADVSFNAIARLLPHWLNAFGDGPRQWLLMVKPQFELRRDLVPHGGVINDDGLRAMALQSVCDAASDCGLNLVRSCDSRLAGRKGNLEIFCLFSR
jgi:23S rRNA (cytidine1920-2'-O)/16S rRNA (cytidine1409-2'-O)-methyltransferase